MYGLLWCSSIVNNTEEKKNNTMCEVAVRGIMKKLGFFFKERYEFLWCFNMLTNKMLRLFLEILGISDVFDIIVDFRS